MLKRCAALVIILLLFLTACSPQDLAGALVGGTPTPEPTQAPTQEASSTPAPTAAGEFDMYAFFPTQMGELEELGMDNDEKTALILLCANFDAAVKSNYELAAQYNINYQEMVAENTDYMDALFYGTEQYNVIGVANIERDGDLIHGNVAYSYITPRVSSTMNFYCYDVFTIDLSGTFPMITMFDVASESDDARAAAIEQIEARAKDEFGVENFLTFLTFDTRQMPVPATKKVQGFEGACEVLYPFGWVATVSYDELTVDLYSPDFDARGTMSILDVSGIGTLKQVAEMLFEDLEGTPESGKSVKLGGLDAYLIEGTTTFDLSDFSEECTMRIYVVDAGSDIHYAVIGLFDENTMLYEKDAAYAMMDSFTVK